MKKLKTYRDVIQSLLDGYEIEYQDVITDTWKTVYKMSFDIYDLDDNTRGEFRFKPSKPSINWEHVHPRFKYLARDKTGRVYLYSEKPHMNDILNWMSDGGEFSEASNLSSVTAGTCDWKDSLIERPERED